MNKFTTTTAMVALMTATLGLSAAAPVFAQAAAPAPQTQLDQQGKAPGAMDGQAGRHDQRGSGHGERGHGERGHGERGHGERGPGMGGPRGDNGPGMGGPRGFLNLTNPDETEIALVRLSQRLDLTAEQQPLFDAFKTAAMSAATNFSDVLESVRPAAPVEGQEPVRPEISEMLAMRIAVTTAELDALKAIQPSADAFFDSLTAEQKTNMMPQRPDRTGAPGVDGPMGVPPAPLDGQAPVPPAPTDGQAPVPPAPPADGSAPAPTDGQAPIAPAING